jgi:hypothetical protein
MQTTTSSPTQSRRRKHRGAGTVGCYGLGVFCSGYWR